MSQITRAFDARASFDGARVLVLGAAGFIGSHLTDRLLDAGASVIGLDNYVTGNPRNLAHLEDHSGFERVEHDITKPLPDVGPLAYVVNVASPASPIDYQKLPIETLRTGALGSEHALDLATQTNARYLLSSTSEVYGDPLEHPQRETYWGHVNPIGPRSMYDEAKRYAEALTMAYHRARGTNIGIARIFNTYGPRMRVNDGRAVPAFFDAALRDEPLPVHGDGSQTRSLCFVSDLVEGLLRLLASDQTGPINLGRPDEITILELAKTIQHVVGSDAGIAQMPAAADDPKRRMPDITLARTLLGWEPTVTLDEGLAQTVEWFRSALKR